MGFFELFSGALSGFYALIPSYGLAIVLLTLAVRVVLLPLSIKQTRSMREMQRIQPEIKKLQAKYKGNRQKMNEELMALYKEHSVNPFGGCLPLLMQFPVLIGLFYVVRAPLKYMGFGSEGATFPPLVDYVRNPDVSGIMERIQNSSLAHALHDAGSGLATNKFLGLRLDCSPSQVIGGKDSALIEGANCGGSTPLLSAIPYIVLILLMGYTTYYQQKQMQASRGSAANDPTAKQMQTFTKIMPFFLMAISYTFPLGVLFYWLTTNVWTIAQQRIVLRAVPHNLPVAKSKKPGGASGGSGAAAKNKKPGAKPAKGGTSSKALSGGKEPAPADEAVAEPPPSKPHPSSKKKKKRR
ncbi:MAG: membrane protein insertase YidC [Actinobacteria bacterium]|nr:membrane protein insertase YidC [Actinomycetota bacterium]